MKPNQVGGISTKLAKRICDVTSSATLEMTARAREMALKGSSVINFAAGELDFDTPEFIKKAAYQALGEGFTKYTAVTGIPELREAISEKFRRENRLIYNPSQIVVSCGAKHSLFNLIQVLCDPGDEVIIPLPYWVSYPEMVRLAQAVPVFIRTFPESGYKITPNQLKKAITSKTKLFLLNSPSNPTGTVYTREELDSLAKIVIEEDIFCISDEIYEKILYEGSQHFSIASLGKEIYERVATVNGVSKTYSMTGWRIGYLGAPDWLAKAVANYQSHSTSNPTSFSQKGALAALKAEAKEIQRMLEPLNERRLLMLSGFEQMNGIKAFPPQGAFYLFCDISQTTLDSVVFASRLLEEWGVVTVPGEAFGESHAIRLTFATSRNNIEEGLNRIKNFIKQL